MNNDQCVLLLPKTCHELLIKLGCKKTQRQAVILAIYQHAKATLTDEELSYIHSLNITVHKTKAVKIWIYKTLQPMPTMDELRNIIIFQLAQATTGSVESIVDSIDYYRYFMPAYAQNYRAWLDNSVIEKTKELAKNSNKKISDVIEELLLAWQAPVPIQLPTTGKDKSYQKVYLSGAITYWATSRQVEKVDSKVINAILQHNLLQKNTF